MLALIINLESSSWQEAFPTHSNQVGAPTTHCYSILTFLVTFVILLPIQCLSSQLDYIHHKGRSVFFFFLIPWCLAQSLKLNIC